jgi:hypothetical protein
MPGPRVARCPPIQRYFARLQLISIGGMSPPPNVTFNFSSSPLTAPV